MAGKHLHKTCAACAKPCEALSLPTGVDWSQLHPDDQKRAVASISETLTHGTSRTEYRLRHRDGTYRWVEDNRRLFHDASGEPTEFIGVWTDITERKRAEDVLRGAVVERSDKQRRRIAGEMGIMAAVVLFIFAAGHAFGWFRWIFSIVGDETRHPYADETIALIGILFPCLGLFSFRRWWESRAQAFSQQNITAALRTLHAELEARIHQRTGELSQSNTALRAEIAERKRLESEVALRGERLRAFFGGATAGLLQVDRDLRYVQVNETIAKMNGVPAADHIGRTVEEIVPKLAPRVAPMMRQVLATNEPILDVELIGETPGQPGVQRSWMVSYFPVRDKDGQPAGVGAIVVEITERRRAEESLRQSEERVRLITETIDDVFWMATVAMGETVYASSAYERIWGRSLQSLRDDPRSFLDAVHPEDLPRVLAGLESQKTGRSFSQEFRIIRPTGTIRWIKDSGYPVRRPDGTVTHYVGAARDITQQKEAEIALRQSEERYRALVDAAPTGIFVNVDNRFAYVNRTMCRIVGAKAPAELMGGDVFDRIHPESLPAIRERIARGFAGESAPLMDQRYLRLDGSAVDVETQATPITYQGRPAIQVIVNDITDRKREALRLRLQHSVTQVLAEGSSLLQTKRKLLETIGRGLEWDFGEFWLADRSSRLLRCIETWHLSSTELDQFAVVSQRVLSTAETGLNGPVWTSGRARASHDLAQDPACVRREIAGHAGLRGWVGFPVTLRGATMGVVGFFTRQVQPPDEKILSLLEALGAQIGQFIEREELAEQFRQAQKMESIGTLAGGIAHDFNNIIAAMTGYTELAKMEVRGDKAVAGYLDAVLAGGARAASLVRQILSFSRQQDHERRPIQLRYVVKEALDLLRATIPTTIEFEFGYGRDLPPVLANATQVHQVVMNLGTNAWHAMKDHPGHLRLKIEPCGIDPENIEQHPGLRVGNYVCLAISDTGCGMDRTTLSRIFEPFFTTKGPGEGTGLGLAVVHGIMQSHEGAVTVQSQPGAGTMFRLYFPAVAAQPADVAVDATGVPVGHGERILVVDDEQPLAFMSQKMLERLGYAVDAQLDPREALEALRADPARYDLVITDLAMPGMSGTDLAHEIRSIRSNLPIILTTGFASHLTQAGVRVFGIRELLSKPISVHAIGTVVARMLTEPKPD